MRQRMFLGAAATLACLSVAYASAQQSFDPRSMDRMPTVNELPSPGWTPDQVKAECLRLFAGKKYSTKMATQPNGLPMNTTWPLLNTFHAEFQTDGEILPSRANGKPLCTVFYSWRSVGYYSAKGERVRLSFNGKSLYRLSAPPQEKTGFLMIADGDSLQSTEYFYWNREPNGAPKPGAAIHKQWGTYTRD